MKQTARDGVSLADDKRTSEKGVFSFQVDIGINSKTSSQVTTGVFSFQVDIGINSKTSSQVTTRQEVVSLSIGPKHRDVEVST